MAYLNEKAQDNLAADIPDTPINREILRRLVEHSWVGLTMDCVCVSNYGFRKP